MISLGAYRAILARGGKSSFRQFRSVGTLALKGARCGSLLRPSRITLTHFGVATVRRSALFLFGLHCVLLCCNANLSAQTSLDGPLVNFSLQAPNYDDSSDVGRHAAFSIILARLLDDAFAQGAPQACTLLSSIDFPDLRLSVKMQDRHGSAAMKECLERIESILKRSNFDQKAFNAVVIDAMMDFAPASLEIGDLTRPDQVFTRLQVIWQQALTQMYQNDPVLLPLLTVYGRLVSLGQDYPAFVAWMARQRDSRELGFVPLYEADAARLHQLGMAISNPSIRPVPQRPTIDHLGWVRVRVPKVGGRSIILIRCDSSRDRLCHRRVAREFCSKTSEQISVGTQSQPISSKAPLTCRWFNVLGISGWIAAESEDEAVMHWLIEEISSRRLAAAKPDLSLVEYAVLVTPR